MKGTLSSGEVSAGRKESGLPGLRMEGEKMRLPQMEGGWTWTPGSERGELGLDSLS